MNKQDTISPMTIVALKSGDPQAFKIVYQQFNKKLFGSLLKLVKSEDIAHELLQEIFLKVWEKRDQIDPNKPFHAYLFQIAENKAYDFFRKVSRDKKLQIHLLDQSPESYNDVEEILINKEYDGLLKQAIEALPPRRRQIFRLCKLDGKSYKEAAIKFGLSTSTINDHIVKATRFVRKYCYTHHEILLTACLGSLFMAYNFPYFYKLFFF